MGTYRRRRAACPRAPRTVRAGYAYQPRALGTYRVPWLPRCDVDEGPDPLWKQALRQVVGLAFNGAQFYLLQYLPAKRADRKAERLQPRGPLF